MEESVNDRIAVVIPCRGRVKLLERAIRSVLGQTRTPDEVIVVDDATPDPLASQLPADVESKCSFIRHETGQGAGRARNTGIQTSEANWIAFLDADDWWSPQHLAVTLRCARWSRSAAVVGAYRAMFSNGAVVTYRSPVGTGSIRDFAEYMFVHGGLCRTSTFLVGRKEAHAIGFDPDVRHEDWDFMLRLASESRVAYNDYAGVDVDHEAGGRFSHSRDAAASLAFLAKHHGIMSRRQRNGFRLRVARSGAVRAQKNATRALLGDLEPPLSLSERFHGQVSRLLCVHPLVTVAARYTYLLLRKIVPKGPNAI